MWSTKQLMRSVNVRPYNGSEQRRSLLTKCSHFLKLLRPRNFHTSRRQRIAAETQNVHNITYSYVGNYKDLSSTTKHCYSQPIVVVLIYYSMDSGKCTKTLQLVILSWTIWIENATTRSDTSYWQLLCISYLFTSEVC